MKIGTAVCEKGQFANGYIHTAWLADGNEVRVPVMIAMGEQDGPVLWINAGVHGQEVSGIFAIQELFRNLDLKKIKGTVVGTPGCNPLGLKGHNKFNPEDQLDLDQQFPGKERGWLSEQMAFHFFNEVKETANYFIDLHALGGVDAVPYTVYKTAAGVPDEINECTEKMALLMGAEFNCHVDLRTATGELPGPVMGAVDIQCIINGIPAFMFEMGAGNRVIWSSVELAQTGFRNVMIMLGMMDGEITSFKDQKVVTKRSFPTNVRGGLASPQCKPGSLLKKDAPIMNILNAFGEVIEEIKAPYDCIVIGVQEDPIVNAGTPMVVFGHEWHNVN